jgi:Undecaprenyl-phosphate glucose phosphotransferase
MLRSSFAILFASISLFGVNCLTKPDVAAFDLSPAAALTWMAVAGFLIITSRAAYWQVLDGSRADSRVRIAIVGAGPLGNKLAGMIIDRFRTQVSLAGVYDDRATRIPQNICGLRVQAIEALYREVKSGKVNKIVVALPIQAEERLIDLLMRLKSLPVDVSILPDELGIRLFSQTLPAFCVEFESHFFNVLHQPMSKSDKILKRTFDIVVAALLIIFLGPVMMVAALAVVLTSRGPIFFRQPRAGLYDDIIRVYKFRTMYAHQTDLAASLQTQRNDPRITSVGRFLRKTSIDELPQLFNVLTGEMSLVGPRPHATGMCVGGEPCSKIFREYAHRHRVKPGLTGWAQVNGFRGAVEDAGVLNERIKHDIYYIDHWSIWFDMEILLKTIPEVAFSRTAY